MLFSTDTTTKNYFESNTAKVLPFISGEWNYNLISAPYVTFAGSGNTINTASMLTASNWTKSSNKVTISYSSSLGKKTSVFTTGDGLQFSVTPSTVNGKVDLVGDSNFNGSASFKIKGLAASTKCFKIVFYTKSLNNNIINLVTQVSSTESILNGSSSEIVDNIDWQRVEVIAGQRSTDAPYSSFDFTLDFTNNTLNSEEVWGLLVSQIQIYEITQFDYTHGKLYPTSNVFTYFRPGESYVNSGNSAIAAPNESGGITRTIDLSSINSGNWNNVMPVSPVVYSPRVLFMPSKTNPIFKNGVLSTFSQYKYFVSEKINGQTSIGAFYPELLSTNKIVLKFNLSQSKPDNLVVNLYNTTLNLINPVSTINVPGSWISDSGVCVLYWNGSSWTNTKWTWDPSENSNMPTIDNSGNISMYVSSTKVNGYKDFNKIVVTQVSSSPVSNYTLDFNNGKIKPDAYDELKRMQVVEISPRLELDMSSFIIDYSVKNEIDNNNTPLPISAMSANSATISFSNIPLSGASNSPLSVFSTNANSLSYITPLAGMLVKNVKFYINHYVPDLSNKIIPAGVFYVETWDNQDIKQTKVNCYDIMKFLQTLPVSDYVSQNQNLINVFSNVLDFAGFTDYDYDQLNELFKNNKQPISTSFFFADSASKTVYKILQEAFIAYQVGAWIDEYGVMRFKNLQNILTDYTSSYLINDSKIVNESYNEAIKTKIGKVLMRYRAPQIKRSVAINDPNKSQSILKIAPDIIWQQDSEDLVPFNLLKTSINSLSQNYYETDQGGLQSMFFTNTVNHTGYCIIEGEIMSAGNIEFTLIGQDKDITSTNPNAVIIRGQETIYPTNETELSSMVGTFSNKVGAQSVIQNPTGRYVNVQRGLFGTEAKNHIVMNSTSDYSLKFNTAQMTATGAISIAQDLSIKNNIIQVTNSGLGSKTMVIANELDTGYSTYSVKFKLPTSVNNVTAGIFIGKPSTGTGLTYFVELSSTGSDTVYRKYELSIYSIDPNGFKTALTKNIDISNYLHSDFNNEPEDALYNAELGDYINLKFVNVPGKRVIYVNKNRINLERISNKLSNSGNYIYSQQWISDSSSASMPSNFGGKTFGFYTGSTNATSFNTNLLEVYATESPVFDNVDYHFQTREFLNALVQNQNISEKTFFVQSRPSIIGLNYYDVQLTPTPSLGAEMFKTSYSYYYYPNKNIKTEPKLVRVKEDALSYSNITSTGYRSKFAIINNSRYAVYTQTGTTYSQMAHAQLLMATRGMITLTPQLTLEKVLNSENINEVVELQSDWIQSKKSAEGILKTIAYASDTFSKDISINIFGNPLIQVGDVVTLTYNLKNIQSIVFFVKSVEQNFNNGLSTTLTLNQITYNGVTRKNLGIVFPYPSATGNGPKITKLSAKTGKQGDSISITGTGFGTGATVLFGKTAGVSVNVVSNTSITVNVPYSASNGPVDISVVSGGLSDTLYNGFSYVSTTTTVQDVLTVSSTITGTDVYNNNTADITWTISTNIGKSYNAFSWSIVGSGVKLSTQSGSHVLDSGTHLLQLDSLVPGDTYTITITPEYIDAFGNVNTGNAKSATLFATGSSGSQVGPITITPSTNLQTPTLSNAIFNDINGQADLNVSVSVDTIDIGASIVYVMDVSPGSSGGGTDTLIFDASSMTPVSSKYVLSTADQGILYPENVKYSISILAADYNNVYGDSNQGTTTVDTVADGSITINISESVVINWTVSTPKYYYKYDIVYSDSTGRIITGSPMMCCTASTTKYYDGKDMTLISTDGASFTDNRYASNSFFSPGSTLTVNITGSTISSTGVVTVGETYTKTYTIPNSNATGPSVTVYKANGYSAPGGFDSWTWQGVLMSDGTSPIGYDYEVYHGVSTTDCNCNTGTLFTSGTKSSVAGPYLVNASLGTTLGCIRVRTSANGTTPAGPWSGDAVPAVGTPGTGTGGEGSGIGNGGSNNGGGGKTTYYYALSVCDSNYGDYSSCPSNGVSVTSLPFGYTENTLKIQRISKDVYQREYYSTISDADALSKVSAAACSPCVGTYTPTPTPVTPTPTPVTPTPVTPTPVTPTPVAPSATLVLNYGGTATCTSGSSISSGSGKGMGYSISTPCGTFYGIQGVPYSWTCCQ